MSDLVDVVDIPEIELTFEPMPSLKTVLTSCFHCDPEDTLIN